LPSPSGSNSNAPSPGDFNELSPLGLDLISPVPSHSADGQPKKISSTKKATRRKLAYKQVSKYSPVKAKNKNPPSKIWFPGKDNGLPANIPQFIHSPQNNDPSEIPTPEEMFDKFFPDELFELIIEESVLYARKCKNNTFQLTKASYWSIYDLHKVP